VSKAATINIVMNRTKVSDGCIFYTRCDMCMLGAILYVFVEFLDNFGHNIFLIEYSMLMFIFVGTIMIDDRK
jgi:hypothetical protein